MSHPDLSITEHAYTVEPREIERVLGDLWRASAGDDSSLIHVRTINLVVFAPVTHATPELHQAIAIASVQHPGRTIALLADDSHAGSPRASVSIACRVANGGKQICGELITISGGDGGAALPSLAASLLVPGVPTFVWWLGDPRADDELWRRLIDLADRVIVDSRTWRSPLGTIADFAALAARSTHVAYTDLQWTALTPWRRMIAQSFDMPQALPYLTQITEVIIEHGARESDRVAALLLAGWLASRLGWRVADAAGGRIAMQTTHATVSVSLEQGESPTGIARVAIRTSRSSCEHSFLPAAGCIHTIITLPDAAPIERMAHLGRRTLADNIGDDLAMTGRDPAFEAALAVAAQIAEQARA